MAGKGVKVSYKVPGLRALRESRGITQDQLSKDAHVGRITIVRLEGGEGANGITIARLASALGVSREALETGVK